MKTNKEIEIEIPNKLLSWVFGYKCKFIKTYDSIAYATPTYKIIEFNGLFDCLSNYPLMEFIQMGKLRAIDCGFHIDDTQVRVVISETENFSEVKTIMNDDEKLFAVTRMIEALEWVYDNMEKDENE